MQSPSNTQQSSPPPPATHTTASPLKSQTSTKPNRRSPLAQSLARDLEPIERPNKRARLEAEPVSLTASAAIMPPQPQTRPRSRNTPPTTATSPNPAMQVLGSLQGLSNEMSKAPSSGEAPAASNSSSVMPSPMQVITDNMQQPQNAGSESQTQTSPVSLSSLGTVGSVPSVAPASGMDRSMVNSPSPMDERQAGQAADSTSPEGGRHVAFTYPGPPPGLPPHVSNEAKRGMSLPNSGQRQGTRSPSTKKHRCPYCATEFTRHHNLKSHLLTHSQEKPYVCSTCQSRFRRLHDLKRHTKLHTGERPHICPKCGRKFARGDALARHNKGPGGCAGRRASMGGFNSDEEFEGDDSMEGMVYGEPEDMEDQEGNERRPGIRRHDAPEGSSGPADDYSRQPSTYPPIQGRPPGGIASGSFPPRAFPGPTSSGPIAPGLPPAHAHSSSTSSLYPPGQSHAVFGQNPVTESPKPLSPGSAHQRQLSQPGPAINRDRSPSMQSRYTQSQFSKSSGGRTPPAGSLSLPPAGPQLPPPHGLQPPEARYTLPSQGGPTHPPTQPSGPPTDMRGSRPLSSQSNSLSSHGQSNKGSGETAGFHKDERIWSYVQSLEARMNNMQKEIESLKGQLAAATQQPQQPR